MQPNKWEAFLSDPELLNSGEYRGRHNGSYLFGKISHDALECLNNYLAVLSLMDANDVKISSNMLDRLSAKKGPIETAVSEIYALVEQCRDLPDSSKEWPTMIQVIGSKLGSVQSLADNFPGIDELASSIENSLVTTAAANSRGLQAIYANIREENYKRLLTKPKFAF